MMRVKLVLIPSQYQPVLPITLQLAKLKLLLLLFLVNAQMMFLQFHHTRLTITTLTQALMTQWPHLLGHNRYLEHALQ